MYLHQGWGGGGEGVTISSLTPVSQCAMAALLAPEKTHANRINEHLLGVEEEILLHTVSPLALVL